MNTHKIQISSLTSIQKINKPSYTDRKVIDMIMLHDDEFTMLQLDIVRRWLSIDYEIRIVKDQTGIYIYDDGCYAKYYISSIITVCYKIDMVFPIFEEYMKAMMNIEMDVITTSSSMLRNIIKSKDWFDIVEEEDFYMTSFPEISI